MARITRGTVRPTGSIGDNSQKRSTKATALETPPFRGSSARERRAVSVDIMRSVTSKLSTHTTTSRAGDIAAELGLTDVYRELLQHATKTTGVDARVLSALRGQTVQVSRDTPLGFTKKIGDVVWPPNQSEGRGLGLEMTRTILVRVGETAVVKVKGAGQAYDHPAQQSQRVNGERRPPIPNPILWGRNFMGTGTPHFGLQDEFARDEFAHLLVAHALSKKVRGRFASAPIPIDAVRLERVMMNGEDVSIVRARADKSLWKGHEGYFQRDIQDMFERLQALAQRPEHADLLNGAADGTEFFRILKAHPKKRQVKVLEAQGFDTAPMNTAMRRLAYARTILAQRFTATHELGQLVLLERGQFRNNIGRVWRDRGVTNNPASLRHEVFRQFFSNWGLQYDPSLDLADHQRAIEKNVTHIVKELGQMYGMLRAFGTEMRDGFHPKDNIGAEVTDFIDFDMPLPIESHQDHPPKFRPLNGWPMYNGGLDLTVDALVDLFQLPYELDGQLRHTWRDEAVKIARKTIAIGLDGGFDHLLGKDADRWAAWIEHERASVGNDATGFRAALRADP